VDNETPKDGNVLTTVARAVGSTAGAIVSKATQLTHQAIKVASAVAPSVLPKKAKATPKKRAVRTTTKKAGRKTTKPTVKKTIKKPINKTAKKPATRTRNR